MIQKSQQQETDRAGQRLFEEAVGSLEWGINPIEEDFGIDYDIQVFADGSPSGLWFKVQLKSSTISEYSVDGSFISQELTLDHARYYAIQLREPIFLVHADVRARKVFWSAPQLDNDLIARLTGGKQTSSLTMRVPTPNFLPDTAPALLAAIRRVYLVLANRTFLESPMSTFAESLRHQPGETELRSEYQHRNDLLKLRRIHELLVAKEFSEARSRARNVISDPDSSIENKFWAEEEVGNIDWAEAVSEERPQAELPLIFLKAATALQDLTKDGPSHLKFYALILRNAAELDRLVMDNWGLTILLHQHRGPAGSLGMAIKMHSDLAVSTRKIIVKYNQCLRLARCASNFRGRWILPRALARIVQSVAPFVSRIGRVGPAELTGSATQFHSSILQICKLMVWISKESENQEGIAMAASTALMAVNSQKTEEYEWAVRALDDITDPDVKQRATELIERHLKRWRGETLEGDRYNDPAQQLIENAAASLGINPADESNPIVRGLQIAARDNTPERVLKTCEHIVTSLGATGPVAREIRMLFGIETAGSKIIHCSIHNYHYESRDLDSAFAQFKSRYCDSCPQRSPRPSDWEYTEAFRQEFQVKHLLFIRQFNTSGAGFRLTDSD